ncbi:AAA family ATPase [Candidatus Saccharibacteria bacterium]|nr:AAA family ATPase [Candidatus Saccharibacteria bacterium]
MMTFVDLILHPKTRLALANHLGQPTHALLLTGDKGVGLGTIARTLATEIAGTNVVIVEPCSHDRQKTLTINIDDIRDLRTLVRSRRSDPLCIIIDEAEKMTDKAPEAFLKSLEEPTPQVFYILTTHLPTRLPATIKSRAQIVEVLPPPVETCESLFAGSDPAKLAKVKFLGERQPAEIVRLLNDEEYFKKVSLAMAAAKDFVQGSPGKRLAIVAGITTRDGAIELGKNVARILLVTADRAKNPKTVAASLNTVSNVVEYLHQNGNIRAQLTYLALNV